MNKIFISMVTFNNNKATKECLETLEKVNKTDFELFVVVIDNYSKEKFVIENKYKNFNINVLRSEKNLGFSGGQNLGIKYCLNNDADFIIILNNDTLVDPDFINELLSSFDKNTGIVAPKIYFAKGYEYHKDRYKEKDLGKIVWYSGGIIDWKNVVGKHKGVDEVDNGQFGDLEKTEYATGCCMMVKRNVFEKVGLFDDNYFLYYEDSDFSLRVKNKGFGIFFQPKAILWHKNAASTGGSGSSLQDYFITRNRLIFGFKYASIKVKLALFRESLRILQNGRQWQKKGIKDFYLRKFGKGTYFN